MTKEPRTLHMGATFGELFAQALRCHPPGALALWDADEEVTYGQFASRVAGFMQQMRAAGLGRGDALAQLSRNKIDAVCTIVASFMLGLRYTPLHPLASPADLAFILADAEIDALVIDEAYFADRAQQLRSAMHAEAVLFSHGAADYGIALRNGRGEGFDAESLVCEASPEDIALIVYTGGTTGRPKGVVHRHRSLLASLLLIMAEWEWPEPLCFLAVTPISHAAFLFLLPVLLKGGSFGMSTGFTARAFAEQVRKRQVTSTFLVPTMIYALLEADRAADADLQSLATVFYGAAPISPPRLRDALRRFGSIFSQVYGQTEAPLGISMLFKRHHDLARPELLASCGVPFWSNRVALLDEHGQMVKSGEAGEICVRGELVMEEYWKRPDETAETLTGDWLHTGDMARADAGGFLFLVDRKKDLIVSGGFNVYPREVEDVILTHPAVWQCCIVGAPDPKWGEAVVALIVLRQSAACEADDIVAYVKTAKGSAMAPKRVEFVDELPLTALGKVDRKQVRARFWKGISRQIN